jgi:GTP cyclohydrolase FolE2
MMRITMAINVDMENLVTRATLSMQAFCKQNGIDMPRNEELVKDTLVQFIETKLQGKMQTKVAEELDKFIEGDGSISLCRECLSMIA